MVSDFYFSLSPTTLILVSDICGPLRGYRIGQQIAHLLASGWPRRSQPCFKKLASSARDSRIVPLADCVWETSLPNIATRTESLQIPTVSYRVGIFSVGFVPEVLVLEIGTQFMAFPWACDTLINSCFLVNNYLTTALVNMRTVAGEGVPSKMMNEFRPVT